MAGIPVVVTARGISRLPRGLPRQKALSAGVLEETRAALVFWYDAEEGNRVLFLFRGPSGPRWLVRKLEGSGDEGIVDAIGLITRTTVETLLDQGALRPAPAEVPPPAAPPPPPPQAVEDTPPEARTPVVQPSMGLAYAGQLASQTPVFSHGGRFSLQLLIGPVFRIALGIELSTPLESREAGVSLEQWRFPAHLGVSALKRLGDWRLGGGITAVFSAVRHTPTSRDDAISVRAPFTLFEFSTEILIQGEYVVLSFLSLFLNLGVEVFPEEVTYKVEGGPMLFEESMTVQPKLLVGVLLFLS